MKEEFTENSEFHLNREHMGSDGKKNASQESTLQENSEGLIITEHILVKCTAIGGEVCVPDGVTVIGANAFKGCALMKRVILPDSVEIISEHAFKGCRSLEEIRISKNLREIGAYAFHRCHSLKKISLPKKVTSLGNCVFLYCDNLKSIQMPGVVTLGKQTFLNDIALEELVISRNLDQDSICECFTGCNKIRTISFSDGETFEINRVVDIVTGKLVIDPLIHKIISDIYLILKIEDGVLVEYLNNVKHIELPEGITEIGKSCFFDKRGIQSVVFPGSLKRIRAKAFRGCMSLEKVTFLSEQVEIEESAFQNCSSLCKIQLPRDRQFALKGLEEEAGEENQLVATIHNQVLENFVMSGTMLLKYRGCEKKVVVPQGTTLIGQRAFAGNEEVDRIELPDSVEVIEREAFADCVVLQTMKLSENIKIIEDSAFENCVKFIRIAIPKQMREIAISCFKRCRALQEVILPEGLEHIGDMAFYGCTKLQAVEFPKSLHGLGSMSFYGCRAITELMLPKGTIVEPLAFAKTGISQSSRQQMLKEAILQKPAVIPRVGINRQVLNGTLRIPEGVQIIEEYEWFCNESLQYLELPESVKEIKKGAFYGCKNLQTIKFPKGMIAMGEEVFAKCENLRTVEIAQTEVVGRRAFAWCKSLEDVKILSAKRIEQESFQGCGALQSLSIEKAEYIGKNAFQFCISLQCVNFPPNIVIDNYGFSFCDNLQKISFHQTAQLGDFCFQDCGNLTEIEIITNSDEKFLTMKSSSFRGCSGVGFVKYSENIYEIKGYESLNDKSLPKEVRQIYASALSVFSFDSNLGITGYDGFARKVTIPEGIQVIEREVFRDREGLTFVNLPKSLKEIGARAFDKTEWLRRRRRDSPMVVERGMVLDAGSIPGQVVIPKEIYKICGWAFANNLELKRVVFEGRVKLEEYAFRNCINIEEIVLEDGSSYPLNSLHDIKRQQPQQVTQIARECYNCFKMEGEVLVECTGNIEDLKLPLGISVIGKSALKESNLLTRLTLQEEITEIKESALQQCKWLAKVEQTEHVKHIGKRAFFGCIRLEEMGALTALESLGESAFENCISLKEIRLSEGIKEIPKKAFYRCSALERVYLPSSIAQVDDTAFAYCPAEIIWM